GPGRARRAAPSAVARPLQHASTGGGASADAPRPSATTSRVHAPTGTHHASAPPLTTITTASRRGQRPAVRPARSPRAPPRAAAAPPTTRPPKAIHVNWRPAPRGAGILEGSAKTSTPFTPPR